MDQRSDLLQLALQWLGTRGLLGVFLAASTTALRWLLGFDGTARELALSFGADGGAPRNHGERRCGSSPDAGGCGSPASWSR